MFDLILFWIPIGAAIAGIIGLVVKILTLRKRPHIFFSLFNRAEISIYNEEDEERISLVTAPIGNEKKRFFGETAKKVSAMLIYEAPSGERQYSNICNLNLPWVVGSYPPRIKTKSPLKSERDIQKALEQKLFDWKERDIPEGRGDHLVLAYGIEKGNKVFFATKPAIGIPLPSTKKRGAQFTVAFLRLEVAGENLASTLSNFTFIMASKWDDINVPTNLIKVSTPSRLRNFLLRIGLCREVKVLGYKNQQNRGK